MIVAFVITIVALYIKDNESRITAKRVSQFHTMKSQLYAEKSKLQTEEQENDQLKKDAQGIILWIVDRKTGKAVFTQGSLDDVKQGSIYNVYHDKEIVGQFRVDDVLEYTSFGQIVNYNKRKFPKNVINLRAGFD